MIWSLMDNFEWALGVRKADWVGARRFRYAQTRAKGVLYGHEGGSFRLKSNNPTYFEQFESAEECGHTTLDLRAHEIYERRFNVRLSAPDWGSMIVLCKGVFVR